MEKKPAPDTSPPPKPSPLKKECPACHFVHPVEVPQCQQCGVIFEKWKDPAQKQAEIKLTQLAQESHSGLPLGITLSLLLLVGVPLSVVLIPDLSTRLLGGKLKYNVRKGEEIRTQGILNLQLSTVLPEGADAAGALGAKIVSSQFQSSIVAKDRDSGGNTSFVKSYSQLLFSGLPGLPAPLETPAAKLAEWTRSTQLNSSGGQVSGGLSLDDYEHMANTAKHQARLRQEQAEKAQKYQQGYWGPGGEEPPEPEPARVDPAEQFLNSLSEMDVSIGDVGLYFRFPKDRVRPGAQWTQPLSFSLPLWIFKIASNPNVTFRLARFERTPAGFCSVIEWETPLTFTLQAIDPAVQSLMAPLTVSGQYKGTAYLLYTDGLPTEVAGTISATLTNPEGDLKELCEKMEIPMAAAGNTISLKGTQRITRL
ncbi:MAG: hypothetical protein LHV69_00320 [Elusimicrobia bacterium]|nr:hypothetical protein [Candidatus Obscuribacterium magneticum]MCB4755475.1 hypothetical protein [Candidatus Obscuribacterium magneticum]